VSWPPAGWPTIAPLYAPGHVVHCRAEFAPVHYLAAGWHQPEDYFTWMDGIEAVIRFVVRRPSVGYMLRLDVVPVGFGEVTQTLEVFFNFFRVGYFEIPESKPVSLQLPAELFIMRESTLTLHCREARRGTEFGLGDERRLGIAVSSWVLE